MEEQQASLNTAKSRTTLTEITCDNYEMILSSIQENDEEHAFETFKSRVTL